MTLIHLLTALCPLLLIATASFLVEAIRSPAEGEEDGSPGAGVDPTRGIGALPSPR